MCLSVISKFRLLVLLVTASEIDSTTEKIQVTSGGVLVKKSSIPRGHEDGI